MLATGGVAGAEAAGVAAVAGGVAGPGAVATGAGAIGRGSMRGVTTGREATWLGSWPGDTTRSTWPTSIRSAFSSWFQRLMSFQFWPVSRPMRISVSPGLTV